MPPPGTAEARDALSGAARLLAGGEAVALFPEGRVGRQADGLPLPLRPGAARLALTTGAPVVLVALGGTDRLVPEGTWRPSWTGRAPVTALVTAPLDVARALGLPAGPVPDRSRELVAAAAALLAERLAALVGGYPAARVEAISR